MKVRPGDLLPALGRSGVSALGVWCLALLSFFSFVLPLANNNEQLRQRAADAAAEGLGPPTVQRKLPNLARRARDLTRLTTAAERHGLRITQRSFEEQANAGSNEIRLTGRLSAETSYLALRRWLDEITGSMPSLAIRTLQLGRPAEPGKPLAMVLEFVYLATSAADAANLAEHTTADLPPPRPLAAISDPFAMPPPPPPPQANKRPVLAPKPTAALPFGYGGRYAAAGTDTYLLTEGDEVHRVRPGEVVAQSAFRFDGASPDALYFTHLPTTRRLSLPIGNLP